MVQCGISRMSDLPPILEYLEAFDNWIIKVCESHNWKHPDITYCSYNSETKEFIIRIGTKVYTAMISKDPTPKD